MAGGDVYDPAKDNDLRSLSFDAILYTITQIPYGNRKKAPYE